MSLLGDLQLMPDWPAVMPKNVAVLYVGGQPSILEALIERGWLEPLTSRKRQVTFLRERIDEALRIANSIEGSFLE